MAQKYFQSHDGVDPALITKADDILRRGYERLTGFECGKGGFDWFGTDPASEALTSFGILEFTEMSKVMTGVDPKLLTRCYDWLLGRRDGKGSFLLNPRVLHVWATDSLMSDAYVLYSLTKAGMDPSKLRVELDSLFKRLETNEDPYMLALQANILHQIKDMERCKVVVDKLSKLQNVEGVIPGAKTSVTKSGGKSLLIETLSLAMLAWLASDTHFECCEKGAAYLSKNCELGGYGNTQSTVLALEAIIAYDIKSATPKVPGKIHVKVDGELLQTVNVKIGVSGTIELPDFSEAISLAGDHNVDIVQEDGSKFSYALSVAYSAVVPNSSNECDVNIDLIRLRNTELTEGEGTEIEVKISNKKQDSPLPMTMVIVGLPGGFDLRHEKMKELVKSEKIASYEVLGARRVACYFRHMMPKETISFEIDCVAAVPGKYTGPASCAYLYYTNEHKQWVDGLEVKINPR